MRKYLGPIIFILSIVCGSIVASRLQITTCDQPTGLCVDLMIDPWMLLWLQIGVAVLMFLSVSKMALDAMHRALACDRVIRRLKSDLQRQKIQPNAEAMERSALELVVAAEMLDERWLIEEVAIIFENKELEQAVKRIARERVEKHANAQALKGTWAPSDQ